MTSDIESRSDTKMYGELVPVGGGDPIPLLKPKLLVGRREECDVVLRFANVSANHCQMAVEQGYWFVKDMGSRNGTKVNGRRVTRKRVDPGDLISFAKQSYKLQYHPDELGAAGPPPPDEDSLTDMFNRSLLDRAGLQRRMEDDRPPGR
jgi:pSer/pThr/pTyr-binding forkhead associated (FHA) protein